MANRLVGSSSRQQAIHLPPVEVHQIETNPGRRARCLKHLLKANHVNYSIVYDKLRSVNHNSHLLSTAYLLGADEAKLHDLYEAGIKHLEPWTPSPAEVADLDWEDFLGDRQYQRAYVDFFEDKLAMDFAYDWKQELQHFLFSGETPLLHSLIGDAAQPLVHLGFAYEMDSKELAMEALGLACIQHNFLHKYTAEAAYNRPSPLTSDSPLDLLTKMSEDDRFKKLPKVADFSELETLFTEHEDLILEYWNALELDDAMDQFRLSQEAPVALLATSVRAGTHIYSANFVRLLSASHAIRVLLPYVPAQHHVTLLRQWWLLAIAMFVLAGRPRPDPESLDVEVTGKDWAWVQKTALASEWSHDASFLEDASMAPPAKRRRRNPVEDSDEEDEQPRANTLANYLVSSPSSPSKNRVPSASPSPVKSRNGAGATSPTKQRRPSTLSNGASPSPKKSKAAAKIEEKGKTADLKTLFSKQAQRATKSVVASDTRSTPIDDIISDPISEEDEISELKASSSSLVGQHARKRLRHGAEAASIQPPSATQRFLRPPKPAGSAALDDDLRPWSERFGPRNLDELAVHKKKVADVRRWLEDVMAGRLRQRVLILKGAAGSGKTTTMRLLAQDLGCELLEWKNPTATSSTGFVSTSAQFDEFLGRGGKFGTLDTETSLSATPSSSSNGTGNDLTKRIILIEEFPNTFSRSSSTLNSFRSSILHYLAAHTPSLSMFSKQPQREPIKPVVLVISETLLTTTSASADSLTAHRLLGPDILRHPGVGVIEFNAIAPSLLAKALEVIVQKEARKSGRRRTPGPLVLKRLGEIGDIRNAISSLEFLCLKGDQDADWGAKVTFTKQKRGARDGIAMTKGEAETLEMVSQREASLGIFHAVGKVVYNKRDEAPPPGDTVENLPPYLSRFSRPKRSQVSVDSLIDETGTDTHTFISALHENYILSCESSGPMDLSTPMDYVNECIEYLSLSDLLCPSRDVFFGGRGFAGRDSGSQLLRQDEMTFEVAVRGMLFSLPNPVKRKTTTMSRGGDAFKMFYPTSLKLWRAKEEIEGLIDVWSTKALKGDTHGPTKNLTDGASAFRKPQASSGDLSWMQRQQQARPVASSKPSDAKEEGDDPPPLLSLGSAARREMLLDRLPYMAHIARARKSRIRLRDLEKIVSFSGVNATNADEDEDEDDDDEPAVAGEAWATDKPSEEASPRKKAARIKAGGVSGMLAQKLVLSDDDIED
ncbi:cell cycle checkpoint protein [Purpureocillium lavendulum]|uniref:Cell cycle checkpoint protein n=1 Tax=Purpureocillium lavendulum TaxID=1247861 RepID=A0AB34G5A4_9HYPO|nr:cell cycle checkpoint protein [Purpureocillium lavendulum]